MILILILGGLLVTALSIIFLLLKDRRKSFWILTEISAGIPNFQDQVRNSEKHPPQASQITAYLTKTAGIFGNLHISGRKSERSAARLSRNIQKALIYTADVRTNAEENRKTASELFRFVAEGSAAVEEIHASIRTLKDQVDIQNREIHQTTESIEGINAALQRISEIASRRQDDTRTLVEYTDLGNEKISKTDKIIDEVLNKVGDVLSLITVINQVASQTNLLSMNAAIEAAHAGDAGRGFAVVAEEIRNLASSTAENAKSISNTLKNLVSEIESASMMSKESGETFTKIEEGVGKVSEAFSEITDKTAEVSDNTQELVKSSETLQSISAQTTSSMDEMEIGAGEINSILNNSKEISEELDRSMSMLSEDTKSINLTMTKISTSFFDANTALGSMVSEISEYSRDEHDNGNLQTKIDFSNLILSHINWVATARAVIDGTIKEKEAGIVSPTECILGKWLHKETTKPFLGEEKFSKLHSSHEILHEKVKLIVSHKASGKGDEAEAEYRKLAEESRKLVQILTTLGYKQFVEWTPALSVKIEAFDSHHQELIRLINKLYQSMESGEGDDLLQKVLQELIEYTDYHFAAEEAVFKKYDYPDTAEHIQMHQSLLSKARSLNKDLSTGKSVLSNEVLDFLQDWVMNHILQADSRYSNFLEGKDVTSLVANYSRRG
ncbi:MAG: bacteriohemerythrin [Spirochaetales bacterium]|nr:bacteriohemerythrin [Spirochaetales bacterium]